MSTKPSLSILPPSATGVSEILTREGFAADLKRLFAFYSDGRHYHTPPDPLRPSRLKFQPAHSAASDAARVTMTAAGLHDFLFDSGALEALLEKDLDKLFVQVAGSG